MDLSQLRIVIVVLMFECSEKSIYKLEPEAQKAPKSFLTWTLWSQAPITACMVGAPGVPVARVSASDHGVTSHLAGALPRRPSRFLAVSVHQSGGSLYVEGILR